MTEKIVYKRYLAEGTSNDTSEEEMEDMKPNISDAESDKEKEENEKGHVSDDETKKETVFPMETVLSEIRNKMRRQAFYHKMKKEKKKAKKDLKKLRIKEKEVLGKKIKKQQPHTIESKREEDLTVIENDDQDLITEEATDTYANFYAKKYEPKVLITTSEKLHGRTIRFLRELSLTIPNSTLLWRNGSSVEKIIKVAQTKSYTDILIVNEDHRAPSGLLVIHLPKGPTAFFKLSNVKVCKEIKRKAKDITGHRPELILSNFKTRLGRLIARMFGALYNYEPEFKGRSVCTFHNQRDYIFFRHHRYEFKNTQKAKLRELGPKFTLMLEWLQEGAFSGDYEWTLKRHEMETSRRKFHL